MTIKIRRSINKTIQVIGILAVSLSMLVSCVYFNTFYNAKLYFSEAEKLRVEKEGELLGNAIIEKYKKVIEKSDIIINEYPKSKYFDDALFLKGRSHYYRGEYDLSEATFHTLISTNPADYLIFSEYWLALNKWKSEKPQPALDDLIDIISKTNETELLAQIYQSQAEIFIELKQDSLAVLALEKAAELTKNRQDKGQIYYRLAELAYEIENYKRAIDYYNNVIKYSFSNERIMDANLKIIQRYRDLNDLKKASKEIQSMIVDPEFVTIHDELELELAKLKLTQNDIAASVQILEDIVVKYPHTETSAEAFYMLGEQSLLKNRDFVKADYYYKQIQKESSKSTFIENGTRRINELDKYKKSNDYLRNIYEKNSVIDSLSLDENKVVLELYNLGELEAFHFNQTDTSIIYFNRIINEFPESDLVAKTMYVLGHLYEQLGDTSQFLIYQELVINNYPDSEFAEDIRLNTKLKDYGVSGFSLLSNAELLYTTDDDSALSDYKNIADLSISEASKRALLFIANEYDYKLFNPDSAYKYYNQITVRFPDSEQAAVAINRIKYLKNSVSDTSDTVIVNDN